MEKNASNSKKIVFANKENVDLSARLELPDGEPRAYAIFAHCFTCSKDIAAATRIARALAGHGIAVLRFDFTGIGNSEGDFANTDFSSNIDDLIAAADFLRKNHKAPKLLIGHSLGGAAVLAAGIRIKEIEGVAAIAAPSDPVHVSKLFKHKLEDIQSSGCATVSLAGREFNIRKEFIEDLHNHDLVSRISDARYDLLILHSPVDEMVDVDHARRIFEAAKHPKSFVSLHPADHLLSDKAHSHYAAEVIAAWSSRFLKDDTESNANPHTKSA